MRVKLEIPFEGYEEWTEYRYIEKSESVYYIQIDYKGRPSVAKHNSLFEIKYPVLVLTPTKHTISLDLTTREKEVLDHLAKQQDLPPEKVMIQALRLYQVQQNPAQEINKLQKTKKNFTGWDCLPEESFNTWTP